MHTKKLNEKILIFLSPYDFRISMDKYKIINIQTPLLSAFWKMCAKILVKLLIIAFSFGHLTPSPLL